VVPGAAPLRLPEPQWVRELDANPRPRPPELVEGLLHQGCKMVLSGPSKSYKSWCLLDLAMSVASGQPWWGRKTRQARTIYINFELPRWAVHERLMVLRRARPECDPVCGNGLAFWNLRGHSAGLERLRPQLEDHLRREQFGLVILDPVYKLLGDRDENSNGEIAGMMNQLELLAQTSGAAVVLAHHFAKGNAGAKNSIDRMSGAGVWARDPDALVALTPHEEADCFTVSTTLRLVPRIPDWVMRWEFPLMRNLTDLNPAALERRMGRQKAYRDAEFMRLVFGTAEPQSYGAILSQAAAMELSRSTMARYLRRLEKAGCIVRVNGKYQKREEQ
jgi:hypothetical protein